MSIFRTFKIKSSLKTFKLKRYNQDSLTESKIVDLSGICRSGNINIYFELVLLRFESSAAALELAVLPIEVVAQRFMYQPLFLRISRQDGASEASVRYPNIP